MKNALADVQPVLTLRADPSLRHFEYLQSGLVGTGLLGGNDEVEGNAELGHCVSEKIVVHIRHNGKLIASLQFAQRGNSISKGRPIGQRLRQGADFSLGWREPEAIAEAAHYSLQNFAVGPELTLLGLRFQLGVELEQREIADAFSVSRQRRAQGGEDARFPIDERSVTIEGDDPKASEVQNAGLQPPANEAT